MNFIMCGKSQNQPQLFAFWVVVANEIDYQDDSRCGCAAAFFLLMRPSLILGRVEAVHRQLELFYLLDALCHGLVQALHFGQSLILSLVW